MKHRSGQTGRTLNRHAGILLLGMLLPLNLGLEVARAQANSTSPAAKVHRKVLLMVQPEYPDVLKNGHFEGQVRLQATVTPGGSVSKVEIKGGNPMLSQYASQAVMRWKYAPGTVQTVEDVVFNFNANDR